MHVDNLAPGHFRPVGGGTGEGAVANAVEAMLCRPKFFISGGRAERSKIIINLRAVGVDDHASDLLSKGKRQRRLAARGRSGNDDERRTKVHGNRNADSSRT